MRQNLAGEKMLVQCLKESKDALLPIGCLIIAFPPLLNLFIQAPL